MCSPPARKRRERERNGANSWMALRHVSSRISPQRKIHRIVKNLCSLPETGRGRPASPFRVQHRGRTSYYFASVTKEEEEEALAAEGRKGARERQRGRKYWGWLAKQEWIFTYTHRTRIYLCRFDAAAASRPEAEGGRSGPRRFERRVGGGRNKIGRRMTHTA